MIGHRAAAALGWLAGSATWLGLFVASVGLGAVLALTGIAQPISNALYDVLSKQLAPPASRDILIVAIDDASIAALGRWPWPRRLHAEMIDKITAAGPRSIVYDILFTEAADARDDAALARAIGRARSVVLPVLMEIPGPDGAEIGVRQPIAALRAAGAKVGHSNVAVDSDGVLRRVALGDVGLNHLAVVAAGKLNQARDGAPALIAFAPQGAFRTIPFAAFLRGDVPPAFVRDKIVIVGATASGLGDRYATPLTSGTGLTPGVETIASIVANVMEHRLVTDLGGWGSLIFVAPALLCLALAFRVLTPVRSALVMIVLVAVCLIVAALALRAGRWIDPVPATLALSLFFPVWGWYRLARVSGFVDRQLVRLAADGGPLEPAARRIAVPDRLEWRTALLDRSIGRMRDLRLFIDASFENLPDATLVIDERGRIVIASKAAGELFQHYCGTPLPRSARAALQRLSELIVSGRDALIAAVGTDQLGLAGKSRELTLRDDRCFQIEANGFVAAASSQSFTILRLVDITLRKRAERDRQHALEFLSHDIRAPQTTLLAMVAQLDARYDPAVKASITRVAERTLSLAQSFVDIARAEAGLKLEPINIADVLHEAVDLLWDSFRAKNVRVRLIAPADEALVLADGLLLARAFQNILTNAVRYAPAGSDIIARIAPVSGASGGENWICKIDDRGPGIARAAQARLFTRFEAEDRRAGGTGLGLSLVKAVCTALGGDVRCYSRTGIGTRFVMRLPRLQLNDTASE